MSRPFPLMGRLLAFGLGWSLVLYVALEKIPVGLSVGRAYGGAIALTGAALALLLAKSQGHRRTTLIFALALLSLLGTSTAGPVTTLLGTTAVLGWVRTGGGPSGPDPFRPAAELVSGVGATGLAVGVAPTSPLVIALCIWLFYLCQLIPLAAADRTPSLRDAKELRRQFEAIRQRVERILAARI